MSDSEFDTDYTVPSSWSLFGIQFGSHHVIFVALVLTVCLVYIFRNRLAEIHDRWRARRRFNYFPAGSFQDAAESGLSSVNFDLAGNIAGDDDRHGLEPDASRAIQAIMTKHRSMTFDEARLIYTQQQMNANGIGADGRPLDPRAVTFG